MLVGSISRRLVLRLLAGSALAPLWPSVADEPKAFVLEDGLKFFEFKEGAGETPRWGQLLRFHYVGYTVDEANGDLRKFDSTYDRNTPFFIKHGNGQTVLGLEEVLHSMRAGGRRRVIVPPGRLSYITDKGPVPPIAKNRQALYDAVNAGQPLVFDIELVKVFNDAVDRGDYEDGDVSDLIAYLQEKAKKRVVVAQEDDALTSPVLTPDAPSTSSPVLGSELNRASAPDMDAEEKRRQLAALGLSTELSAAGQAAAEAKRAGK